MQVTVVDLHVEVEDAAVNVEQVNVVPKLGEVRLESLLHELSCVVDQRIDEEQANRC